MIQRLEIRNWQSLRSVDLTIGRFTVIVGASNSGKTALIRALHAVANNPRRRGMITRGAKTAQITVVTDHHEIVYQRAETTAAYRLRTLDGDFGEPYTALAGTVPEQITTALGIPPAAVGQSLHIAGQFDPPFLLAPGTSGAAVARTLGELTNVTVIFAAVKEANRRRLGLAGTLKTRQGDLSTVREQARTFADLPAQLVTVDTVEQAAADARQLAERIDRLRRAADSLQTAETVLGRAVVPSVPTDSGLTVAAERYARFRVLLRQLRTAATGATTASAALDQADADVAALHGELHDALAAAGICPTCGQHVPA